MFCIDCAPKDLPVVKKEKLKERIDNLGIKRSTLYSFGHRYSIDIPKYCFGHLFADYCFQLIMHYIKNRHSLKTVSKSIINRMGLKKFFDLSFSEGDIYDYYNLQFETKVM